MIRAEPREIIDPEIQRISPEQRVDSKRSSRRKRDLKALDVSFVSIGSTSRRMGGLALKSIGSGSGNNSHSKDGDEHHLLNLQENSGDSAAKLKEGKIVIDLKGKGKPDGKKKTVNRRMSRARC